MYVESKLHTRNRSVAQAVEPSVVRSVDVFIAGGGPAGLACAIAAAMHGLSVEVADGMKPPIDKACGEGLMPDTVQALDQLGIDLATTESHPFRGIRFIGSPNRRRPARNTQAEFPQGHGRGMKRVLLHQLLLDRAVALGVRLSWETLVKQTAQESAPNTATGQGTTTLIHTSRHTTRARYLVGADGHQSRIRAAAGLEKASIAARRIGLRQHFAIAPWTDYVEVYWSDHGQAYVTPISSSEVCIAFVAHQKFETIPQALSFFPGLLAHLATALPSDRPRGSITLSRKLHRVTRDNIALIGDASGSVDAVTGEGLALCFRQALALADALEDNNLAAYQRAHVAMHRLPHFMARTMLLMDSSPFLRSKALSAFHRRPQLFEQLLQTHVGHAPIEILGSRGLIATGAHILAG